MTSARAWVSQSVGAGAGAWLLACAPAATASAALDLYYERSVMLAADSRCGLFEPPLTAALAAAQAQARGASLRSGDTPAAIIRMRDVAEARAAAVSCRSSDVAMAAGRVRAAFDSYSRLPRMTYAGDLSQWVARRDASATAATWRLSQTLRLGPDKAVFGLAGLAGEAPQVVAVGAFADGAWPYAARLVVRDSARVPQPWLGGVTLVSATEGLSRTPLSRRLPPRGGTRSVMAEARTLADPLLTPKGGRSAVAFRFPAKTAALLETLDPREAVALEFVFAGPGQDKVRSAYVEVGDFAAGRAFLTVAAR